MLTVGTAVHEIAHALTVELSGGEITEIDLTEHVTHSGDYNIIQQVLISYAPLIVNSSLAGVVGVAGIQIPSTMLPATISDILGGVIPIGIIAVALQLAAFGLAFILAAAALPSFEDAKIPFDQFKHSLATETGWTILTLPITVPVLLVGLVPLGFTFVRSKSIALQLLTELAFATAILLQATQTVVFVSLADVTALVNMLLKIV